MREVSSVVKHAFLCWRLGADLLSSHEISWRPRCGTNCRKGLRAATGAFHLYVRGPVPKPTSSSTQDIDFPPFSNTFSDNWRTKSIFILKEYCRVLWFSKNNHNHRTSVNVLMCLCLRDVNLRSFVPEDSVTSKGWGNHPVFITEFPAS